MRNGRGRKMYPMLKFIVKEICGMLGHVWTTKQLTDHKNYIDIKRCNRCGSWDYDHNKELDKIGVKNEEESNLSK